ncbi:hypothetical protein EOM81_10355 [bacterium]|nr:hypothetical protein [bacterium]
MTWTIDSALEDAAIDRFEKTSEGVSIWLKEIPVEIKILLSYNGERAAFNFSLSHAIKTPEQSGPYRTSRPWGQYLEYALHLAVDSLTKYYKQAVKNGFKPSKDWLVAN